MQDFILNEIYDLQNQRDWISQASKDAYSLYKQLSIKESAIKRSIEELILKHKLYFTLNYLELYTGIKIENIDLVFEYKGEIKTENLWRGFIDNGGIIKSDDESDYEIEYDNKDGIITYRCINYDPYSTITIPNVLGFINLEYVSDRERVLVDYDIPDRTYKK
ncbi:MAG: hypothetical protein NC548_15435 [Lachnospiraceae bacterium]|nr:hypothetical protein [Lachnospiraceae bacterium]